MSNIEFITVNHVALKRPVDLRVSHIYGLYFSENSKSTHILISSTAVPVNETVAEVKELMRRATAPTALTNVGATKKEE